MTAGVPSPSRPRVDAVLASVLVAWLVWSQVWPQGMERWAGIDFVQFWAVGQAGSQGGAADVYSTEGRARLAAWTGAHADASSSSRLRASAGYRQRFETFSTPFLYQSLHWLARGDYDRDLAAFQMAGLAAALAAVLLLARMMGYGWTSALLLFLLLSLASEPMASDMRVANVNRFQLLAMALWLWLQRSDASARQLSAGVLLGLLVAFKPTLAPAVLLLLLVGAATRQWRRMALQAAGLALGGAAAVASSSVWWGSARPWWEWARALRSLERDANVTLANYNFAAAQVLSGWGVPAAPVLLAVVLFVVTAAVLWAARRGAGTAAPVDAGRVGLVAGPLALAISVWPLQLVWLHYYLLFVPLALWLLRPAAPTGTPGGERPGVERWLATVAVMAALGSPHLLPVLRDRLGLQAASYVLGSLCLVVLGWIELHRACRAGPGMESGPSPGHVPAETPAA